MVFFIWDILGLISFILVFYYSNWDSLSGALNTILSNRWGDFFIIYFFCNEYYLYNNSLCLVMIILIIRFFTKRSQFPFFG